MEYKDYAMDFERIFTYAFDCYKSTRNGANMETYIILERMVKDLNDNTKSPSQYELGVRIGIVSTYLTVAIDNMRLKPEYHSNKIYKDYLIEAKHYIVDNFTFNDINNCIDAAMKAIGSVSQYD